MHMTPLLHKLVVKAKSRTLGPQWLNSTKGIDVRACRTLTTEQLSVYTKICCSVGSVTYPVPCLCQYSTYTAINSLGRTSTLERQGLSLTSHKYFERYCMVTCRELVHIVMHCTA